jgi:adenylate kinase family enzyme
MRISIIGLPGSGKSTLARNISNKLQIPHLHIDRLWFEAGGHKVRQGDAEGKAAVGISVIEKVRNLVTQDAWVSDGWYAKAQELVAERADEIIFIDISLGRRLFNHLRRTFFSERHPELSKLDDIKFLYQIVRRTFKHGPKIREFISKNSSKVKTFRSYREVNNYLAEL